MNPIITGLCGLALLSGTAFAGGRATSAKTYGSANQAATHEAARAITAQIASDYRYDPGHATVVGARNLKAVKIGSSQGGVADRFRVSTKASFPIKASIELSVRKTTARGWISYKAGTPTITQE
jgi:hypothetical protein